MSPIALSGCIHSLTFLWLFSLLKTPCLFFAMFCGTCLLFHAAVPLCTCLRFQNDLGLKKSWWSLDSENTAVALPQWFFISFTCSTLKPIQKCKIQKQRKKRRLFQWRTRFKEIRQFNWMVFELFLWRSGKLFESTIIFQIWIFFKSCLELKKNKIEPHASSPSPTPNPFPFLGQREIFLHRSDCCLVQHSDTHYTEYNQSKMRELPFLCWWAALYAVCRHAGQHKDLVIHFVFESYAGFSCSF